MKSRPGQAGGFSSKTTELAPDCDTGSVTGALLPPERVYGWDWSATTHSALEGGRGSQRLATDPSGFVPDVLRALGAVSVVPGKGLQGWSRSMSAFDAGGYALGSVFFGGGRNDVHVRATSSAADQCRRSMVELDTEALTARVDTRVDTLRTFEDLTEILEDAAAIYGSRVTFMESYTRRKGEKRSAGRTLYLGAPTSAVRVRVYEKWLESPGEYVEGTNRVEVQLRPPSKVKQRVSGWGPAETFCASKTTQSLAVALGTDLVEASSLHVAKGTPDLERTLAVMGEQYGPAVERWLALSGGDLDRVMDHLTGHAADSRLALVDGLLQTTTSTPKRPRDPDEFSSVGEPVRGGPYAPALYGQDGAPF